MSVTLSDAPLLWGLAAARLARRLYKNLHSGRFYCLQAAGFVPEKIAISPPDLRLPDLRFAQQLYSGHFEFAGESVELKGQSLFNIKAPSLAWEIGLHSFRWLRHLHAAQNDLARVNAKVLLEDWFSSRGHRIGGIAWEPEVVTHRIIAWIQHANFIFAKAKPSAYHKFMNSLGMQFRYLRSSVNAMGDNVEKLRARIALAFASLALEIMPPATGPVRNAFGMGA